jgi:hypothetical protein
MEVFGPRPDRKPLSARELSDLTKERGRDQQESLAALPREQREKIANVKDSLEEVLTQYLTMPGADVSILDHIGGFVGQLDNSLSYVSSSSSATGRMRDTEAALLGASFLLDPSREGRFDMNDSQSSLARRFLELVDERFGRWIELSKDGK